MKIVQSVRGQYQRNAASRAGPIAPSDRIAAIDMVRGIALFGVMAINVVTVFRVSIFERFLPDGGDGTRLDRTLYSILMVGIDLKAFALFSLLFGVGLAIQYDHLSAAARRTALLVRRLAFLMLVGAVHLILIWNGDILFEYAIAGFVVLPFLFQTGSRANRCLPMLAVVGLLAGGVLAVAQENGWLRLGWRAELSLQRLSTVLLACGYAAAIVWASNKARAGKLLAWAVPLG